MSILDEFPTIIRLPLRAVFLIVTCVILMGLAGSALIALFFLLKGAWWVYITYNVVFWTVNSLFILLALTIFGAWLEDN